MSDLNLNDDSVIEETSSITVTDALVGVACLFATYRAGKFAYRFAAGTKDAVSIKLEQRRQAKADQNVAK